VAGVGLDLEERCEAERFDVDGAIHHAERGEEAPDPRLRREDQRLGWPALPQRAECRNRQKDVAQRSGMNGERQRRRRASAASWR
jgi:hypothetical protein